MKRQLSPALRGLLITLAWGVMTSAVLLAFVFQGYYVPGFRAPYRDISGFFFLSYALVFSVSVISGMLVSDLVRAVMSSFLSLAVAASVEFLVLSLPSLLGLAGIAVLAEFGIPPLSDVAVSIVFYSLFPVTLLLSFTGAASGALLSDRYLG